MWIAIILWLICNMWFAMYVLYGELFLRIQNFEDCKKFTLNRIFYGKKFEDGHVASNQSSYTSEDIYVPWVSINICEILKIFILENKLLYIIQMSVFTLIASISWTILELFLSYQQCVSRELLLHRFVWSFLL